MKLSARDRRTIIIGAGAIAGLLLINLLLLPWIDSWSSARAKIDASHAELSELEQELRILVRLHERLKDVYAGGGAKSLITASAAQVGGPEIVRKALSQGGLGVKNIKSLPLTAVRQVPDAVLVPFEVQAAGKVEQLTQCLSQMAKADAVLIVDQISLTNNPQDPGNLTVNITLSMLAQEAQGS